MCKSFTRKLTIAFVTLVTGSGFLIWPLQQARAVSLKERSVVSADMITLGDIFEGLPQEADAEKILGAAPRPGHDMTLNARTLMRIAVALDLPWRPATTADQITLRRAATVIDRSMLADNLKQALSNEGVTGSYNVLLPEDVDSIALPENLPPEMEITHINYRADNNTFKAEIAAPSAENPIAARTITGRIEQLIPVPVLRENLQAGTIIGTRDIDTIEMPKRDIKSDMIVNVDSLIGMAPRRLALAGTPLKLNDVEAPRIVERGDFVTMVFNEGGLTLTAKGKALENGAKGDTIRVVNPSSNKTVEGIVTASQEVTVASYY